MDAHSEAVGRASVVLGDEKRDALERAQWAAELDTPPDEPWPEGAWDLWPVYQGRRHRSPSRHRATRRARPEVSHVASYCLSLLRCPLNPSLNLGGTPSSSLLGSTSPSWSDPWSDGQEDEEIPGTEEWGSLDEEDDGQDLLQPAAAVLGMDDADLAFEATGVAREGIV